MRFAIRYRQALDDNDYVFDEMLIRITQISILQCCHGNAITMLKALSALRRFNMKMSRDCVYVHDGK